MFLIVFVDFLIVFFVLASAIGILFTRQTIYALLLTMLTFILSALYFINSYAFFVGSAIVIVYIGAITMLFLYAVMFLEAQHHVRYFVTDLKAFFNTSLALAWAFNFFIQLTLSDGGLFPELYIQRDVVAKILRQSDLLALSSVFYTSFGSLVPIVGILLFVAIVIATDVSKPTFLVNKDYIKSKP